MRGALGDDRAADLEVGVAKKRDWQRMYTNFVNKSGKRKVREVHGEIRRRQPALRPFPLPRPLAFLPICTVTSCYAVTDNKSGVIKIFHNC